MVTTIPQQQQTTQQIKRFNTDYYVEGFATTYEPYVMYEMDGIEYYERIDPHAFDDADMSDIIMQYDHQGKVMARKSNDTLIVEPQEKGLFIAADLQLTDSSKQLYKEIRTGLVTKMSWAFTVREQSYDIETRTRTILKVDKVYDISAVSIPANPGTEISARVFVDGVIQQRQQELLEHNRKTLKLKLELEGF